MSLDLRLHSQQGRALMTEATEALYGGAAGGGKSHLLRVAHILWAASVPGYQGYLVRRSYAELISNHMEGPASFPELLGPAVRAGHCEIVQKEIRWSNGSKIFLRHLHHRNALINYQGAEIHGLSFDELTHFTDEMYRYLRGRCRLGGLKVPPGLRWAFPRILSGCNPGGIGHHWVKKTFVDHGPYKVHRTPKKEGGMLRTFIPARLEDNPTLLKNDPDYVDRLEGLGDPALVRAMRTGDWKIVAGSKFGDIWRDELHTCDPFAIPQGWPLWRSMDDGFAAPAAIHWFTKDPDAGTIYVIREIYRDKQHAGPLGRAILAGDRAIRLQDGWGDILLNEEPLSGVLDSAAFANTGQSDANGQKVPSRGEQMNALGCRWKPALKPTGSRIQGAQNLHRLLQTNEKDPHGRPGIIFFTTCENAIRTIPVLGRDKDNPEDVNTEEEDHAYDSIRYGLQYRTGARSTIDVVGV